MNKCVVHRGFGPGYKGVGFTRLFVNHAGVMPCKQASSASATPQSFLAGAVGRTPSACDSSVGRLPSREEKRMLQHSLSGLHRNLHCRSICRRRGGALNIEGGFVTVRLKKTVIQRARCDIGPQTAGVGIAPRSGALSHHF